MLSTAKLSLFELCDNVNKNDKSYKKNKYTNHIISPFDKYHSELNTN